MESACAAFQDKTINFLKKSEVGSCDLTAGAEGCGNQRSSGDGSSLAPASGIIRKIQLLREAADHYNLEPEEELGAWLQAREPLSRDKRGGRAGVG